MEPIYYGTTDQRVAQSQVELAFMASLVAAGVPVVGSVKLGNNWVFDGAVNGTRLLLEFHGIYWHTRPEVVARDARKADWARHEHYQIITVWETDYAESPEAEVARVVDAARQARAAMELAEAVLVPAGDKGDTAPAIAGASYGDWRDRFLAVLAEGGIVREACIGAGVSRKTAYQYRADDADFAELWRLALQDAADRALATYRKRAIQQSDRAMEFFITTRDPEIRTPASRVELTGANGEPLDTLSDDERAARLAAILDSARARRDAAAARPEAA